MAKTRRKQNIRDGYKKVLRSLDDVAKIRTVDNKPNKFLILSIETKTLDSVNDAMKFYLTVKPDSITLDDDGWTLDNNFPSKSFKDLPKSAQKFITYVNKRNKTQLNTSDMSLQISSKNFSKYRMYILLRNLILTCKLINQKLGLANSEATKATKGANE